jgi:hypothetical protein
LDDVRLLPENESGISPPVPEAERAQFYADPDRVRDGLRENRAIVLDVAGGQVRDVTPRY